MVFGLSLNEFIDIVIPLFLFILGTVVYALFVFKFDKFIANNRIFDLNLAQYSRVEHPLLRKIGASLLWLVEFVFIFPIFAFFWFILYVILLGVISQTTNLGDILLISMAVVSTVRVTSYYNEELSRDVAKLVPFAILAIFFANIKFIDFERMLMVVQQIPLFWKTGVYYLLFFMVLELFLRTLQKVVGIFKSSP